MQKTNKNLYGYGDDFYWYVKQDLDDKKLPNVRKLVKYIQAQVNDMCEAMHSDKDVIKNMGKEINLIRDSFSKNG